MSANTPNAWRAFPAGGEYPRWRGPIAPTIYVYSPSRSFWGRTAGGHRITITPGPGGAWMLRHVYAEREVFNKSGTSPEALKAWWRANRPARLLAAERALQKFAKSPAGGRGGIRVRANRRRNGPDYLRGAGFTWDKSRKRLVYGDTEYTPAAAAKTFGLDGSFGLTPAVMRAAGAPESAVKAAMAAKPHNQRRPTWAGSSGARGRAYVGNPRLRWWVVSSPPTVYVLGVHQNFYERLPDGRRVSIQEDGTGRFSLQITVPHGWAISYSRSFPTVRAAKTAAAKKVK